MDGMVLSFLPEVLDDDFKAIGRVMCPRNLIETELFVRILKNTANSYMKDIVGRAEYLLSAALKCVKPSESFKKIHYLNEIIYRAPANNKVFMEALVERMIYSFLVDKYPMARRDILYYKSFDLKLLNIEGIVIVQTLICLCLYLMREMIGARCALDQLEEFLDLLPTEMFVTDKLNIHLHQLENYKTEIMEPSKNIQFKINNDLFAEFKADWEVPFASSACEFVSEPIGIAGVYARREIAKGEVVISEDVEYFQFSAPFMNCANCAVYQEHLYNCSNCRYKSYCSVDCLKADLVEHRDECYGYKIGLIQMLEAAMLFRCFLHAAKYLSPAIVGFTELNGPIRDASVAWDFITQFSLLDKTHNSVIRQFLSRQPNCKLLSNPKWRKLITTSFRLAVFIQNDTSIIKSYFGRLQLTKDDSIKLIAAILLRLNIHIALNSQKEQLQFGQNMSTNSAAGSTNPSEDVKRMTVNAFEYFSINAHSDFVNCFNELQERIQSTKYSLKHKRKALQQQAQNQQHMSPMSEYIGKLIRFSIHDIEIQSVGELFAIEAPTPMFVEQHFSEFTTSKRCHLLSSVAKNFHKFMYDYFCYDGRGSQDKISLCPTLKRFKHSCVANVEIGFSTGKKCIGKTNTHIRSGTELTACHESVNFLEQSRSERHAILQEMGIICKCDVCSIPASMEPINIRNTIYCAFCEPNMEITEVPGQCSQCHVQYEQLLDQYITFISYILREIDTEESNPKTIQRELAILYGTYNSYVTMHFSEEHELRFAGVLSFVDFLTLNGFLSHASDVIISLHCAYYSYYVDSSKIYYRDIDAEFFNKIRNIMESYMHNLTESTETDAVYPKKLLVIVLHMLKRQEQYLDASIDDLETYNTFLENYTMYYKWKKIINSHFVMPKSLQDLLIKS